MAQRDDAEGAPALVIEGQASTVPRVLCLDDEPAMLAILTRALGARFEVVALDDPVAALSLLERTRDFSVVISDMKMPQMHGADFLARVKRLAPSTTRLALTACLEEELTSEEVFGILTKPCPLKLLHESVAAAIQHHELLLKTETATRSRALAAAGALSITTLPDGLADSGIQACTSDVAHERDLPLVTARDQPPVVSARLYLQLLGKYTELGPRATLLGRSPDCDIVVNDPRVELRHLRFFNSWRGITLQALSRASDVRLNGQAFTGVRHISVGDWISIGPFHAEVRSQRDVEAEEHSLTVLAAVAEKLFLLGQGVEAERILTPRLEDLERRCRQAPLSTQKDLDTAVALALRLAGELRAPAWIDYVFRIFTVKGRVFEASTVELLHDVMRRVPGASLGGFREYLRVLELAEERFSPAELFSMRRIAGLEPLFK